jgi:mono/diheme cytochrome c family protein
MRTLPALLLAALAVAAPALASEPPAPSAERGKALAQRVCAACHALQPGQASPQPPAPAFTSFAGRFTELTLQRRLNEIAETGHTQMPATAVHSDEIEDLVAYLNSQPAP